MLIAYWLVVLLAATELPNGGAVSAQAVATPTYEEFAHLPPDRREVVWAQLTAETRTLLPANTFRALAGGLPHPVESVPNRRGEGCD